MRFRTSTCKVFTLTTPAEADRFAVLAQGSGLTRVTRLDPLRVEVRGPADVLSLLNKICV
jgi:hypothetical protein